MVSLDKLRPCFEGIIPSVLATCNRDGIPNISYISNVHYVDECHVALTFQFFNKTHQNIIENPHAKINLIDPESAAEYRLHLLYRRTESSGPLYEEMRAKLASIAEISGMQNVFKLKGADVYKVLSIEQVSKPVDTPASCLDSSMFKLRQILADLNKINDLASLTEVLLRSLKTSFNFEYIMLLLADDHNEFLYTLDSLGYESSGVGSEVPFGVGTIGICAKNKTPLRIVHTAAEYSYHKALDTYNSQQKVTALERNIDFPGLTQPRSQMAIPIMVGQRLLGVIYLESKSDLRFSFKDEDLLLAISAYVGQKLIVTQAAGNKKIDVDSSYGSSLNYSDKSNNIIGQGKVGTLKIRYLPQDGSIFVDQEYLIKGVAGKILWRLFELSREEKRHSFSNRELRVDKNLQLPEVGDNLEARLVLLKRRLIEKTQDIRIVTIKRGVFELKLTKSIELQQG